MQGFSREESLLKLVVSLILLPLPHNELFGALVCQGKVTIQGLLVIEFSHPSRQLTKFTFLLARLFSPCFIELCCRRSPRSASQGQYIFSNAKDPVIRNHLASVYLSLSSSGERQFYIVAFLTMCSLLPSFLLLAFWNNVKRSFAVWTPWFN